MNKTYQREATLRELVPECEPPECEQVKDTEASENIKDYICVSDSNNTKQSLCNKDIYESKISYEALRKEYFKIVIERNKIQNKYDALEIEYNNLKSKCNTNDAVWKEKYDKAVEILKRFM